MRCLLESRHVRAREERVQFGWGEVRCRGGAHPRSIAGGTYRLNLTAVRPIPRWTNRGNTKSPEWIAWRSAHDGPPLADLSTHSPLDIAPSGVTTTLVTSVTSKASKARHNVSPQGLTKDLLSKDALRFLAVRAVQAGRAYFVTACPLRSVPEVLIFDEPDLPPQLRAQRVLNKARVPEIARYLTSNPDSYVLSAITASVDGEFVFDPLTALSRGVRLGELAIAPDARLLINDGQHRRAAISAALRANPSLGNESVPLVLFLDAGLSRSQQIFADLNRHVVRPTKSLNVLYDHRDRVAKLARRVASDVCPFNGLTELERSSLSNRSSNVFTLSGIHQATDALLRHRRDEPIGEREEMLVLRFWQIVGELVCGWGFIGDGRTAADLRREFIHTHAVTLHALGTVANELVARYPKTWQKRLRKLAGLDWSRSNPLWEGRAIQNGRISKAGPSLILTANVLRARTGLPLSATEIVLEETLPEDRRVAA